MVFNSKMTMLTKLMCLALISTSMLIQLTMATDYTVGAPTGGWDSVTNLQTWALSEPFAIGDNIIFQYGPTHNVIEVTKTDYDSCQTTNVIQAYTDGATTIPLAAPGKRYFICGTPGHCMQGMKVEVDTVAALAAISTPPPLPSVVSTPLPASAPLTDELPTSSPIFGPTQAPFSPFSSSHFGGIPLSPSVNGLEPLPISSGIRQIKMMAESSIVLVVAMMMILVVQLI